MPPNMLVMMTDQQRYDSLGCYGAEWVQTPYLDGLAADGVVFDNCYVTNPICTPSRASLLTGKHLPGHGVYQLHDVLPPDEVLLPKRLRAFGYRTALFGKLHVSGRVYEAAQRHPNDGFDVYEWCLEASIHLDSPLNGYARWLQAEHPAFYQELCDKGRNLLHGPRECHFTHWAAERTIDFLNQQRGDQPFFCLMSVFDPHNPYEDYPLEMLDRIEEDRLPEPVTRPAAETWRPCGVRQEAQHSYLGPFEAFTREDLRAMRRGYFASLALLDLEVGRVLHALEANGLAENTIVVFVSDHGDMLGDHGLLVKGAFFYDPSVKVPLLIRWPGQPAAGTRVPALVQPHDLAATLLTAAGAEPETVQGLMPDAHDLAPLIRGADDAGREFAVCCYRNTGISDQGCYWDPPIHATMLRDPRYKLNAYHADPGSGRPTEGELYDLRDDPQELHNRWNDPAFRDVRQHLTERLLDWLAQQEIRAAGSRGGAALPDRSQQLVNALK